MAKQIKQKDSDLLSQISTILFFATKQSEGESELLMQYAMQYYIIVIGEAASKLSEDFKRKFDAVRWERLTELRNIMAHKCHWVDPALVLESANTSFPMLRDTIRSIKMEEKNKEESKEQLHNMMQNVIDSIESKEKQMKKEQRKKRKQKKLQEKAETQAEATPLTRVAEPEKYIKRLDRILKECDNIEKFAVSDPSMKYAHTVAAVKMSMLIIGFYSKERLQEDFKRLHPLCAEVEGKRYSISWGSLSQVRNQLAHYFDPTTDTKFIKNTLPTFKAIVPHIKIMLDALQKQVSAEEMELSTLEASESSLSTPSPSSSVASRASVDFSSSSVRQEQKDITMGEKEQKKRKEAKRNLQESSENSVSNSPSMKQEQKISVADVEYQKKAPKIRRVSIKRARSTSSRSHSSIASGAPAYISPPLMMKAEKPSQILSSSIAAVLLAGSDPRSMKRNHKGGMMAGERQQKRRKIGEISERGSEEALSPKSSLSSSLSFSAEMEKSHKDGAKRKKQEQRQEVREGLGKSSGDVSNIQAMS